MSNLFTVVQFEFLRRFRNPGYLFVTFVLPFLLAGAFFAYQIVDDQTGSDGNNEGSVGDVITATQDTTFGYVDRTTESLFPSPDSYPATNCVLAQGELFEPEIVKRITSPGCFTMIRSFDSLASGKEALEDNDIDLLYVIEADYVTSGAVSVYAESFEFQTVGDTGLFTDFVLSSLLQDASPNVYDLLYLRLRDPAIITEHEISTTGIAETNDDAGQNLVVVYAFGMLLIMTVFWGSGYLMQSVVQEKESRTIEILLSSIRPTPLLIGKIIAMGLLSLVQVTTLLTTVMILGQRLGDVIDDLENVDIGIGILALMFLYFVMGYLLLGSLMAVIGAMSTTLRESQNLVIIVTLPAIAPFFFVSVFAEEPNSPLVTVLSLVPFTAPLAMTMRLAITDVPVGELLLSLGLTSVSIVLALWLASRMFGVDALLKANAIKLGELPKLILGRGS